VWIKKMYEVSEPGLSPPASKRKEQLLREVCLIILVRITDFMKEAPRSRRFFGYLATSFQLQRI
jgi:hypothetical protein